MRGVVSIAKGAGTHLHQSGHGLESPVPRDAEIDNRLARKICQQLTGPDHLIFPGVPIVLRCAKDSVHSFGGDDQQEQVDAAGAATMVRTKRSWPGTSTTLTRRPPGSSSSA